MDRSSDFAATTVYLNTASMGLPPRITQEALTGALQDWAAGRAEPQDYDDDVTAARAMFAEFVRVPAEQVAIGHQVAPLIGPSPPRRPAAPRGRWPAVSSRAWPSRSLRIRTGACGCGKCR